MSAHTKTPWIVDDQGDNTLEITSQQLFDDSMCPIAIVDTDFDDYFASTQRANAEIIVRAVNAHDDLVAALKLARTVVELKHIHEVLPLIDAALAKAAQS